MVGQLLELELAEQPGSHAIGEHARLGHHESQHGDPEGEIVVELGAMVDTTNGMDEET